MFTLFQIEGCGFHGTPPPLFSAYVFYGSSLNIIVSIDEQDIVPLIRNKRDRFESITIPAIEELRSLGLLVIGIKNNLKPI